MAHEQVHLHGSPDIHLSPRLGVVDTCSGISRCFLSALSGPFMVGWAVVVHLAGVALICLRGLHPSVRLARAQVLRLSLFHL